MTKKTSALPRYCKRRVGDHVYGYVILNGKQVSLGAYGTEESRELYKATLEQARLAMQEEGSDAFTYGCMSMAFLDMDNRLENELGVPFVNPVKVSVRIAEMMIDFGLKHNKISFPTPQRYRFR